MQDKRRPLAGFFRSEYVQVFMKRKGIAFPSLLIMVPVLFLSMSCDIGPNPGRATITVYNNSDYDVTDLFLWWDGSAGREFPTFGMLKSGERFSFEAVFSHGHLNGRVGAEYTINGRKFTWHDEIGGITYPGGGYFSLREIRDRSRLYIRISNDGYELSGGEPSSWPIWQAHGPQTQSATITVFNDSGHDVTGLLVLLDASNTGMAFPGEQLRTGARHRFEPVFRSDPSRNVRIFLRYTVDGRQFTWVDEIGGISYEYGWHYSAREIRDGSRLYVHITGDGYELSGGEPSSWRGAGAAFHRAVRACELTSDQL